MAKSLLCVALFLASIGAAVADNATTTYTDPTEQAFSIQVPKGWQAKAGIVRNSPVDAKSWISVATGDRTTIMFIGDPSIPMFAQRTSSAQIPLVKGSVEAPYENGQQFAADYGNKVLPRVCANVQLKGTQPEPGVAQDVLAKGTALAQEAGMNMPAPETDGGSALFTCQANGRQVVARFTAVTQRNHTQYVDMWHVGAIMGFSTPAGLEGKAQSLLMAMNGSLRWNPDWRAREVNSVRQAIAENQQQAAYESQALANNAAANRQMLYNQYVNSSNALTASHNAFMQQMNSQRDSRNAAFAQHMYQKSVGQQNEMMYIQNQQCIHRVYNQPGNACNVYVQH